MHTYARHAITAGGLLIALPALAMPAASVPGTSDTILAQTYSDRPSDYSNGYGTNAANSTPVGGVGPYGGYVVNQYGFGNYVSGPQGYGGYPAGSAGAEIWRQREQWKCENNPESC